MELRVIILNNKMCLERLKCDFEGKFKWQRKVYGEIKL